LARVSPRAGRACGPQGDTIASRLEVIEVGIDEDGDVITSCVIVPVEGEIPKAAGQKLSGKQKLALDCLTDLLIDGKLPQPEWRLPNSVRTVKVDAWRKALESRGILDSESSNPRARWHELKTGLMSRKLIAERDGWVWRAS
jgi:hypothetical protein